MESSLGFAASLGSEGSLVCCEGSLGFESSLGLSSVNTRGGGDLGSGNLTCNVARAVSRRDVFAAVCYMHGARGCVLHGARGRAPAAVCILHGPQWGCV